MSTQKTWYMHTIDGRPAAYDGVGRAIWVAGGRHAAKLVPSLTQIRREQRDVEAWFADHAPSSWGDHKYGYVLVRLPE